MNDMKPVTGDIKAWLAETAAIAQHPIYVSDAGAISCAAPECLCAGKPIAHEMAGRRHTVTCFVEAIAAHRKYWTLEGWLGVDMPQPLVCENCMRKAARDNGQ